MTSEPAAAVPPTAAALTVEEVVAGYGGVLALQGVSIAVQPATITAVLGANGAGKTTLLAVRRWGRTRAASTTAAVAAAMGSESSRRPASPGSPLPLLAGRGHDAPPFVSSSVARP